MPVGSTLQAARVAAGLSLADLTRRTGVREHVLEAMERDDFAACRGSFYARANLRAIAPQLGLDPGSLIAAYDAQFPPQGPESALPAAVTGGGRAGVRGLPGRRPNWSAALAVALVLVTAVGLGRLLTGGDDPVRTAHILLAPEAAVPGATSPPQGHEDGADSRSSSPGTKKKKSTTSRDDPTEWAELGSQTGPPPAEEPDSGVPRKETVSADSDSAQGVTVRLSATDPTWVSVVGGSGRTMFEGTLEAGERRTFVDDRRVRLVVGNVDGVRVSVNGKRVRLHGEDGDVARAEYLPAESSAS